MNTGLFASCRWPLSLCAQTECGSLVGALYAPLWPRDLSEMREQMFSTPHTNAPSDVGGGWEFKEGLYSESRSSHIPSGLGKVFTAPPNWGTPAHLCWVSWTSSWCLAPGSLLVLRILEREEADIPCSILSSSRSPQQSMASKAMDRGCGSP